jgi:SAM-dependent methyltransferase
MARQMGLEARADFQRADANQPLPFAANRFDALLCIDSMNHFADRLAVLKEWQRVLKPGGLLLYTDPVVISGAVSNEELAVRSSIGFFLFMPPGVNERLIHEAGLTLIRQEDRTENAALVAGRWQDARAKHRADLIPVEGEERYEGLQRFFAMVHSLTAESRLSRIVFVARK